MKYKITMFVELSDNMPISTEEYIEGLFDLELILGTHYKHKRLIDYEIIKISKKGR